MYLLPYISTVFKLQYIYLSYPNAAVYLTMLQMPPKKQGSCFLEQRVSLFLKKTTASASTSASSAVAIAAAIMRQSPGAVGAPTATTCRYAVNDPNCPSEPTTRVDISSVCANAVDQNHCPTNAVDQHRCDSDVDAILNDRKSQKVSPLARSHSSVNTSSIEARNAASLEHQLQV